MTTYSKELQERIITLGTEEGFSGRAIASILGLSKSGVNDFLKRHKDETLEAEAKPKPQGPRILCFDFETAAATAYCFGRNKQFISDSGIKEEGGWIIMAGVREYGQPEETTRMLFDYDDIVRGKDEYVTYAMNELYKDFEAICCHNALGFDHKVLQTRSIMNGFGVLPSIKVLDTLQIARKKLRLPTNKLDTIGAYFGIGRKLQHAGIGLWKRVQEGDTEALDQMLDYCEQDVNLLHNVYKTLQPLGHQATLFNQGMYFNDGKHHCKDCGSTDVQKTGNLVYTQVSAFEEFKCGVCGSVQRGRKPMNTREDRAMILTSIVN